MDNYSKLVDYIERMGLSAVEVLDALVDWHGTSIISDEFMENQQDCEGWLLD